MMLILNLIYWTLYFPLIQVVRFLGPLIPKVRERLAFEAKNGKDLGSKSFGELTGVAADYCFEFSSEGEYQQVASLVEDLLRAGKRLELVFFSPSVERTIVELAKNYSSQLRYLRYPLFTGGFRDWVTAKKLILVRYDFFPELLFWALDPNHELGLLWLTFKKERAQGKSLSRLKLLFLKTAKLRVYASALDAAEGTKLGFPGVTYDFRMEQIRRRIDARAGKFAHAFPLYSELKHRFDAFPRHKRLIVGNAWPVDLELMTKLPPDVFVVVVPHQLKPEIIEAIRKNLVAQGRTPQIIHSTTRDVYEGHTFILDLKGVLCELYADFGKAYVGGGFGESVHSLLEPLVGGSEMISCGPRHFRSTEFDLARDLGHMREVNTQDDFLAWLAETPKDTEVHAKLKAQIQRYPELRKDLFAC